MPKAPRFIYIKPPVIIAPSNLDRPGIHLFSKFFNLYGGWVLPIDRTNTITTPVRTISLFPVPPFKKFTKSYEEICNDRAREVLALSDKNGGLLYVFWSGGIDSTCVMVSLLKMATPEQKKKMVALLTQESIIENPRFYEEHIRGNVRAESSTMFPHFLGGKDVILSGENNDQVMGSDKVGQLIMRYGEDAIHAPYRRETFFELFGGMLENDERATNAYLDIFERLRSAAPVPLSTNFEYLWWINFALKWQAVVVYSLLFTARRNVHLLTEDYMGTRYLSFYNTDDFQLWSMNNLDKRIKDTWKSYKWVSKEVIYEFTKDANYRDNKTKKGSRAFLTYSQRGYNFLDEHMKLSETLEPEMYLEPENDFT